MVEHEEALIEVEVVVELLLLVQMALHQVEVLEVQVQQIQLQVLQ